MKRVLAKLTYISAVLSVSILCGCASLPKDFERIESFAFTSPQSTRAGKTLAPEIAKHPGLTGVYLMDEPHVALQLRNAMAGIAEKTLDVQYYIWQNDKSGRILFQGLLDAADRGVRVRVLLDDFSLSAKDIYLSQFASHPNLEIRLFNPFAHRVAKNIGFITNISRVNHRMHNKIFVMDNVLGVLGGRNIADHYFGIDEDYNFRDLDVLAAGPAVQAVSDTFDLFWNSKWAYPIGAIKKHDISIDEFKRLQQVLKDRVIEDISNIPFALDVNVDDMYARLGKLAQGFVWAQVSVLHDLPEKVANNSFTLRDQAEELLANIKSDFSAEIAYLIPGKAVVKKIQSMVDQGINVRLLTNSLASNDTLAAHAGFATYRRRLLTAGANLYEYKPDAVERKKWSHYAQKATTRLHSKTYVLDKRYAFIGSFNMDPRSIQLNTEIGLLIDSPVFAEKVLAFLDTGIHHDNSYQVFFKGKSKNIEWREQSEGVEVIHRADPKSTWWQRVKSRIIRIFPIEHHL